MSARYLIRFDDICPTMNLQMWDNVESICKDFDIKPLLAVVPDNHDPELKVNAERGDFWERVREYRDLGWTIGLHGYRHLYVNANAGMLGLNPRSEFAGLTLEEQREKVSLGLEIFKREEVTPQVWIAPSHSFDENTLIALREQNITAISDGYFLNPHTDSEGTFWLPQQMWRFRPLPFGVWTLCFHHNPWTPEIMSEFRRNVERYHKQITNFDAIQREFSSRKIGTLDTLMSKSYGNLIQLKRRFR